jgi:alpha 1,6-mannosyltransferase
MRFKARTNKIFILTAAIVSVVQFLLLLKANVLPADAFLHLSHDGRPLRQQLAREFPYDSEAELPKIIWQTWRYSPSDKKFAPQFRSTEESWSNSNPDHRHEIVTDTDAVLMISRLYARVPKVLQTYRALPKPVLKANFFRYLILLARGGIHSDIDTTALKSAADWIPADMEPYGIGIGIEADPDRPDWHDSYARRIQSCQWTILSKPDHPILADIVASITEETLERQALGELTQESMKTVMKFTGPGVWTDSIFKFCNDPRRSDETVPDQANITWHTFANLRKAMKVRDVLVLPITAFSPGVAHMGSGSTGDPMALLQHAFSGETAKYLFVKSSTKTI